MGSSEAAVAAIRTCKTRESLDEMLKKFEISNAEEIIECLDECMYNPQRFFFNEIPQDVDLEFTKQIFLTGTWRLNEFYDRMQIPPQKQEENRRV
jgi:uncharacterized protein YaaN involved in tellurite resistance